MSLRKRYCISVVVVDISPANAKTHSKLDLLVKVRYQNPLPAPPCPPKLLNIPTDPKRYTRPEFLDNATNEMLLPMIVDAECGMPLDLGKWEALWEDGADDHGAQRSNATRSPQLTLTNHSTEPGSSQPANPRPKRPSAAPRSNRRTSGLYQRRRREP